MTVRIETASENSKTIVSVAGRLAGVGARELLRTCQSLAGELVLDLNRVLPHSGRLSVTMDIEMEFGMSGMEQAMTMGTFMEMDIRPK